MTTNRARRDWIIEGLARALRTRASATLRRCIYDTLRTWIQNGVVPAGTDLPSSRALAAGLGVSRNTALSAIDHLRAEGFVIARAGAGVSVARIALPGPLTHAAARTEQGIELSRRGQTLLEFCAQRIQKRAFTPGVPALDLFPQRLWQRMLRRHRQHARTAWLDYQARGGHPALKESVADYVRLARGVRCRAEQVIITHGAQQAFDLIARMLADPEDIVWVEEPGYPGAKASFLASGLRAVPLPVDGAGANPDRAPADSVSPQLIYVTPSHQYPRGVTLTMARRLALLAQAERHNAWIIEDDYDSEFRYVSSPLSSLQGLAGGASVLYVGTFSKVLYPGLRLGYLVLPGALVDRFRRANTRLFREGDYVVQSALAEFMDTGHFARHVARMRRCYQQRQNALRRALASAVEQGLALSEGHAGMHLVVRLASLEQEQHLVDRAFEAGITLAPLSGYYIGPEREPGLVLGYAACHEQEIARAGEWLGQAWLAMTADVQAGARYSA